MNPGKRKYTVCAKETMAVIFLLENFWRLPYFASSFTSIFIKIPKQYFDYKKIRRALLGELTYWHKFALKLMLKFKCERNHLPFMKIVSIQQDLLVMLPSQI